MNKIIETIIGGIEDKKDWRAMEARAKALPADYRMVYEEIKHYMWTSSGMLGSSLDVFRGLLELLEEGAANGSPVLDITGPDVAAFCDELVRGEKTYAQAAREKLNRTIAQKLKN